MFITIITGAIAIAMVVVTDAPVWIIIFTSICCGGCVGLWLASMINSRGN